MQNKYVCDTGDFGKFYLLKKIAKGFTLGINWYLVDGKVEKNNDGKHIDYLKFESKKSKFYYNADADIYTKFQNILETERKVQELEKALILPSSTKYYNEVLNCIGKQRKLWFSNSFKAFESSNLIFCDPDNGFKVESCSINSIKSVKYVLIDEVENYFNNGKSVLVYQHLVRKGSKEVQVSNKLIELNKITNDIKVFYFGKGTGRLYYLLVNSKHKTQFDNSIKELMSDPLISVVKK